MSDRVIRGTFPANNFRFVACETAELCSEGIDRLKPDWISGWIFSEALTCATLMSVGLSDGERLSLRWKYPGRQRGYDRLGRVRAPARRSHRPPRLRPAPALAAGGTARGGSRRMIMAGRKTVARFAGLGTLSGAISTGLLMVLPENWKFESADLFFLSPLSIVAGLVFGVIFGAVLRYLGLATSRTAALLTRGLPVANSAAVPRARANTRASSPAISPGCGGTAMSWPAAKSAWR